MFDTITRRQSSNPNSSNLNNSGFNNADLTKSELKNPDLANPNLTDPISSLYIHVPFCTKKCSYCDYYSISSQAPEFDLYYQGLVRELEQTLAFIEQHHNRLVKLETLYFGGGTPSILPPSLVVKIISLIRERIGFSDNIEITMEVNPEPVCHDTVVSGIEQGVNRISLGFQASQNSILKTIGRLHTFENFLETLALVRSHGIENVSADLMFGLPGQSLEDTLESGQTLLRLGIPHISFYSLILEERTLFYKRYFKHPELLPDEDLERAMYRSLMALFKTHQYRYYELSSMARSGFASRHNSVYWTTRPYLGIGPAAHSYFNGMRKGNVRSLKRWLEDPWQSSEIETIDFELAAREYAMLAFRTAEGYSEERFRQRFAIQSPFGAELERLLEQGLIRYDIENTSYVLTDHGLDFANLVFMEFL